MRIGASLSAAVALLASVGMAMPMSPRDEVARRTMPDINAELEDPAGIGRRVMPDIGAELEDPAGIGRRVMPDINAELEDPA
ncbi:hypothetical protein MMC06_005251, partial [Schaereria dolodes]|nr:hypothetical protein [Schaereria dolodes]